MEGGAVAAVPVRRRAHLCGAILCSAQLSEPRRARTQHCSQATEAAEAPLNGTNGAHAAPPTKPAPDATPSNGELNGHGANGDANGAPPPANGAPPSATEQMEALTQEMMMMNGGGAAAAANMRARGQHTQVFTDESQNCIVRLHQTNIVTVRQNGDLVLSSGGWRTHQTLKGINTALKTFSPGMQVLPDGHVAEGAWRVSNGSGWSAPFADGITLPGVGPVNLAAQAAQIPGYFEQMSLGFDASNGYGRGGRGGRGGGGGKAARLAATTPLRRPPAATTPLLRRPRRRRPHRRPPLRAVGRLQNGGGASARAPLATQPLPEAEATPTDLDAYDDIPVETSGEDCPPPVEKFADIALHPGLQANIDAAKFVKPTPVQRHSLSIGIARRDVMACRPPGRRAASSSRCSTR